MSAHRGWLVEPLPPRKEWHESHYSRMADKIAARYRMAAAEVEIYLQVKGRFNRASCQD